MRNLLTSAFFYFAGPVTLLGFLLWLHAIWNLSFPRWKERKKEWGITALYSLLGAVVIFGSITVGFKVLSDETNLLSVANMLALFGKASNTEMWTYYYHTYHALNLAIPSRPILFPVLTALVHAVNGVRPWSAFVVNFLCFSALLFLAIHWARKVLPALARPITFFVVLMSPVLVIGATSGGFDLCSLFFGFFAVLLWQRYLNERSENNLRALVFTLVCFASVRYESILALPLVFVALAWSEKKIPSLDLFGAAGCLVLPIFIQRYLTWGTFENPPGVAPFSLGHLVDHLPSFFDAFFLSGDGPYPIFLHWLGVAGLILALRRPRLSNLVPLAYGAFLLVLLLSHHFGFAGHPTQARLFLPLSFALSLLAIYFVAEMKEHLPLPGMLALFVLLFVHHHEYAMHDPLSTQLTMTREMRHLETWLATDSNRGDLFVYDRPGQLTALGSSTVSWDYFRQNQAELLGNLKNKLYTRILLIERVKYSAAENLQRDGYKIVSLAEHQLTPEDRLRISRIEF